MTASSAPVATPAEITDSNLVLKFSAYVQPNQLRIEYACRNHGIRTVALFDGVKRIGHDGYQKLDPSLAYVSFSAPNTITVKRINPELPLRKSVEQAIVPFARLVAPGQSVEAIIHLALPVPEFNPYYPPDAKSVYRNQSARKLRVCLEYLILVHELKSIPAPGFTDWVSIEGPHVPLELICAEVAFASPLPILQRSDLFEPL